MVTMKTADKRGAGTDSNVFVQFYGIDGKTEEIMLRNKTNNFERGMVSFECHRKPQILKIDAILINFSRRMYLKSRLTTWVPSTRSALATTTRAQVLAGSWRRCTFSDTRPSRQRN
jgi:hypothetical protein